MLKTASRSRSTTLLRPETDEADVDASESDSCRAKGLSEVADLAMGVSSVVGLSNIFERCNDRIIQKAIFPKIDVCVAENHVVSSL